MILSVCQAMMDIRYIVESSFLEANGLDSNGYTQISTRHQANNCEGLTNETLSDITNQLTPAHKMPGGSSLNTLRTIAKKTKIKVSFIGAIGDDETGKELIEILSAENINHKFEKILNSETAKCKVLICNNHRTMLTDLGASIKLSEDHITKNLNIIEGAKLIYMCAFFVNAMESISKHILEKLEKNQLLIFNISNQNVIKAIDQTLLLTIIKRSYVIIGNLQEFHSLYEKLTGCENVSIEPDFLSYFKNCKFICTDGENIIRYCEDMEIKSTKVHEVVYGYLDTCGAGDYFAAGVIASLYENQNFGTAINQGKVWAHEHILVNSKRVYKQEKNIRGD